MKPFQASEIMNPKQTNMRREAEAMAGKPADASQDEDMNEAPRHVVADPSTKRRTMSQADFSQYPDKAATKKTSR